MKVKIKTITPFHVGTGNTYTLMEAYVSGSVMHRVDLSSAIKSRQDAEEYIKYAELEDFKGIGSILKNGKTRYTAKMGQKVKPVYKGELKEIRETVKDSARELPYIPGSTLKGAIRTALMINCLKRRNWQFSALYNNMVREYGLWNAMKNGIQELNIQPLGKDNRDRNRRRNIMFGKRFENLIVCFSEVDKGKCDAKYDIFKFLQISDFYPVSAPEISVENVISKSGYKKRYSIVEVVEGEFEGEITLAPELKKVVEDKKYKAISDKIKILGLSHQDVENLKQAEKKMVRHIISSTKEFIDDVSKQSKEKIPDKANIRFGFGIGTLYQGFWSYMANNLPAKWLEDILKSFNKYYYQPWTSVGMYPKSRDMLEDGSGLGWAEIR